MKKIILALVMTVLFQNAFAFNYSRFSVKWTDADGMEHNDPVTKKATDPRHIIALLKELYCNPEIPGSQNVDGINNNGCDNGCDIHYGNQWNDKIEYMGRIVGRIPNEDILTCVLVELADGAESLPTTADVEAFEKNVKAVTLLADVAQNPDNTCYVLSITGNYDNFYFASKGKPGKNSKYGFWERMSATANAQGTSNLFETVTKGGIYKMTHNCGDIIADKHYCTINPGGNAPYLRHLTLVVPKNRLKAWEGRDKDGEMTWYNPDNSPRIGLYRVTSFTSSVTRVNEYDYPDITLNWTTNLRTKDGLDFNGKEKADLYEVKEDGSEEYINTFWKTDMKDLTFSHTFWNVEPREVGRYKRFRVVCYPFDDRGGSAGHATEADSYIEIYVPGKNDEFNCQYQYHSRFEESVLKNSYKNTFNITSLAKGSITRTLHRTNADGSNPVDVATFATNDKGSYTVVYHNAMDAATQLRYDNDALVTCGAVKDGIEINDYFFADTKDGGDRSGGYIYTFIGGENNEKSQYVVPVYAAKVKSTYNTSCYRISDVLDDIYAPIEDDDNDHMSLTAANNIEFDCFNGDHTDHVMSFDFYKNHTSTFHSTKAIDADASTAQNDFTGEMTCAAGNGINTYGTNRVAVELPQVSVDFEQVEASHNDDTSSFGVTLAIRPQLASSVAPYVYYYRVWRVEEGEGMETKVTLINNLADKSGAKWATSYGNIKFEYPCGDSETDNAGVMRVRDIFQSDRDNDHESRMVSYIVRMYSTTDYQDNSLCLAPASDGEESDIFNPRVMISQCVNAVALSNHIVTGVNDVNAQKTVSSVRYTNMLGATSDKPFDGVNLVVTTYTDGTQSTVKMCK